MTKAKF